MCDRFFELALQILYIVTMGFWKKINRNLKTFRKMFKLSKIGFLDSFGNILEIFSYALFHPWDTFFTLFSGVIFLQLFLRIFRIKRPGRSLAQKGFKIWGLTGSVFTKTDKMVIFGVILLEDDLNGKIKGFNFCLTPGVLKCFG